jgi:hypothetical protein
VNTTGPELDRDAIIRALRRLAERLAFRGVVADLYVFGGAAMALAYDTRRSTRDIDALVEPHGVVFAEAAAVALGVHAASPRHLLAMKVMASRRRDGRDIAILARHLGLATADEVLSTCAGVFPDETPPQRARLLLDDVLRPEPA